jgi:hypothetical protein
LQLNVVVWLRRRRQTAGAVRLPAPNQNSISRLAGQHKSIADLAFPNSPRQVRAFASLERAASHVELTLTDSYQRRDPDRPRMCVHRLRFSTKRGATLEALLAPQQVSSCSTLLRGHSATTCLPCSHSHSHVHFATRSCLRIQCGRRYTLRYARSHACQQTLVSPFPDSPDLPLRVVCEEPLWSAYFPIAPRSAAPHAPPRLCLFSAGWAHSYSCSASSANAPWGTLVASVTERQ